jgi:hypothetical protein
MYEDIVLNKYQTPISELGLDKQPQEVQDQFWDFFNNVPFIRSMVSPNKPRACDLPRDSEGKIIVDITQPHILEDIDYFRPSAIHYQKYGRFTDLRPNANPNSEFGKWIREERRRCLYGYIRPYDGEWITGDHYFFLNYCPISLLKKSSNGGRKAMRVIDFPFSWEGNYYRFHYLNQAREHGLMAAELARRGCGKSFCAAAMLAKRFILGESFEVNKRVVSYITATDKAKLTGGDQTLDKFQFYIDFIAENMQWPSRRLYNSLADMNWQMGYKDLNTGTNKGTLNSVVGKSSQNDASKLRGTRGVLYLFEEAGTFDNLLTLWSNLLPSVSDGESVFGLMYLFGTSGDQQSDFAAMQEIMYNPIGYKTYGLKNVYDKEGQGRPTFTYFFPAYINRSDCYDEQGNSDVTKALLEILVNRYNVKYNSTDINTITKCIAEIPITPQEAILRTRGNIFPVADLTQRLAEIDNDPHTFDDVYVGDLTQEKDGTVSFKLTGDQPIRDFPLKDNKVSGALEIFKMPEKDAQGKVFPQRYIIGHDPVDNDEADTMSLSSTFVLDLWTDTIVAEYTGRHQFADDNFEMLRKLCIFYNAKALFEGNIKGCFSYFSRMNCLYMLADTPEYLKDKDIIKNIGIGNNSKGVKATKPVNDYANRLIRDWLLKPVTIQSSEDGKETTVFNLTRIRNRALIKELMLYNPDINVDRVRALGLLMLYREQFMVTYNGDPSSSKNVVESDYLGNDDYFTRNYDNRLHKHSDNVTDS